MNTDKAVDYSLDVIYASDENYVQILCVSMLSLLKNNQHINIHLHILDDRISAESRKKLMLVAETYGTQLNFISIPDLDLLAGQKIDALRWSKTAFARLYLSTIVPDLHQVLYIDCDTLVLGDLSIFCRMPLPAGCSCAAVVECMGDARKANVGLRPENPYINSGLMFIDLDQWRDSNMEHAFSSYIKRCNGRIPYVDQGVINAVLKGSITCLEPQYNVMTVCYDFDFEEMQKYRKTQYPYTKDAYINAKAHPVIVHFTTSFLSRRPWINAEQTHPFAEKWREYKALTPWADIPLWEDLRSTVKRIYEMFFHIIPRSTAVELSGILHSTLKAKKDACIK